MTRLMFDSTKAADVPAGSTLVMGYVDGSSAWSDADWQRFPDRILVRLCIFNDRWDANVIDCEPRNNDARGVMPWVRGMWLRGKVPTVYCFTDRGPIGYRISDVRDVCDAAGVRRPLILITDFDNRPDLFDPASDPEIIGKQYANATFTGGHYDASVVADFWPGVDGGDEVTQAEFNALADVWWKDHVQGPATLDAMKRVYDPLVTHVHEEIPPAVAQPTSQPITKG